MSQAVISNTSNSRVRKANLETVLDAKGLIAAYRKALTRQRAADEAQRRISYPDHPGVTVTAIGPGCVIRDVETLDKREDQFIEQNKLTGVPRLEFRQRMAGYREVLTLLGSLHADWRSEAKIDEIEAEGIAAYDEVTKTWKALLSRIASNRREIPEIARFLSTDEANRGDFWRSREAFAAIGKSLGKGVR